MNEKLVKMCLMTFNVLCLFVGLATFAGGMLLQFNSDVQNTLKAMSETASDANLSILSVIMLAVGGLIILVSFVGCCGVMSESKCMIGLYCAFLILLLVGQLVIGGLGLYYGKEEIKDELEKQFRILIDKSDASRQGVLDSLQEFFECCGFNGPDDFAALVPTATMLTTSTSVAGPSVNNTIAVSVVSTGSPDITGVSVSVNSNATQPASAMPVTPGSATVSNGSSQYYQGGWPSSCCKKDVNDTTCKDASMTKLELQPYLYESGCAEKVEAFIKKNSLIIGAVSLGFAFLEILSIIAGCMLYKSLD